MKIAIDTHMIGERETGNETYTSNLIKALLELDRGNDYFLYTTKPSRLTSRLAALSANTKVIQIRPAIPLLRVPLGMPFAAGRQGVNLLHVNYVAPPWCPCPTVVTVHDISYEFFPEFFSLRDRLMLSTLVPLSVKGAAKVIADSENTKRDIIACYGLPEEKVMIIPVGVGSSFRPVTDEERLEAVKAKYGVKGKFILTVGNLQPRKNLIRLVKAFLLLRESESCDSKVQLAIVGQAFWRESEIYRAVEEEGLKGEVIFTGYVPDEDLPLLYNAAELFVFPSLYEGFGLPPLEAMACGTPVVCSNAASLPEVVGDAALMIDPYDVKAIAQAIFDVLSKPSLRGKLKAKGLRRAASFSWRETAKRTLQVYEEVGR